MDKKITQLNAYTTPQPNDVSPIVDVGAGETKKITFASLAAAILSYIQNSLGGLVQSVTGLNTDNTDPANPIVKISVDGVTITGLGTPGSPLTSNGAGGFGSSGTKLAIDTTQKTVSGTGETTFYTISVPGGTLGSNDALRFTLPISSLDVINATGLLIRAKYGGSTIAQCTLTNSTASGNVTSGYLTGLLLADNSAAAQKGNMFFVAGNGDVIPGTNQDGLSTGNATSAVDSTVAQDLVITVDLQGNAGCTLTTEAIVVEKIAGRTPGGTISIPGKEYVFEYLSSDNHHLATVAFFDKYLIVHTMTVAGSAGLYTVWTTDPNTGAFIQQSNTIDFQKGFSISEDGLYLYTLGTSIGGANASCALTLKKYDTTLSLIQTSTGTITGSANNTVFEITGNASNAEWQSHFVQSGHLVCLNVALAANNVGADGFAVDMTISGASLTTQTATDLLNWSFTGPVEHHQGYAVPANGSVYIQTDDGTNIYGFTYAANSFTLNTTTLQPVPDASPLLSVGGFNITTPTTIGLWRNTSIKLTADTDNYLRAIFDNYTI